MTCLGIKTLWRCLGDGFGPQKRIEWGLPGFFPPGYCLVTTRMTLQFDVEKSLPRPSVWVSNFSFQVCFWWLRGPNFRPKTEDSGNYKPSICHCCPGKGGGKSKARCMFHWVLQFLPCSWFSKKWVPPTGSLPFKCSHFPLPWLWEKE